MIVQRGCNSKKAEIHTCDYTEGPNGVLRDMLLPYKINSKVPAIPNADAVKN